MIRTCLMTIVVTLTMSSPLYADKVINLGAKESKSLTNHTLWTLNATCNIKGKIGKSKILVTVNENQGNINGKKLSKGQATSVDVKNNAHISVTAEPGTKVTIRNLSNDSVQADCTV